MSSTQQALGIRQPMAVSQSRRPPWRIRLQGSDTTWAIAFVIPYVAVFAAFVVYPVIYGLCDGPRSVVVQSAVLRSACI